MEWKLFRGDVPYVSTLEYHIDRERAPHLEQGAHQERLGVAAQLVQDAALRVAGARVSDLGCGDGGLLSLVQNLPNVHSAWGYDFTPANVVGWEERHVRAELVNFIADRELLRLGEIVVLTEVLEHLADPHDLLRWLRRTEPVRFVVASSPRNENDQVYDGSHAWAWDDAGYRKLFNDVEFTVIDHRSLGIFQVVLAS
jgi:trans-aconitate methyltransferase